MTDRPVDDLAFDRAIRATLADLAPDAAPSSLRAAVAAVPLRSPASTRDVRRTLFAIAGLAAAVVLAVGGLGLAAGLRGPLGGLGVFATPSPSGPAPMITPLPTLAPFVYRVVVREGSTISKPQVNAVSDVMVARLQAYGIGNFSAAASDGQLTYEIAGPLDDASRAAIRELLGTTGRFSVGQPVANPPAIGDAVAGAPLLAADSVKSADIGSDQTGSPTVDINLTPAAAAVFADATNAHVGEYLPIALDGKVLAAPVVMDAITDGKVQIRLSSDDQREAPMLVAILQSGPLPMPVQEVAAP